MSLTQLSTNVQVPQDMVGKVAFITGSAKNLGKEIALGLARRGCDVVIQHRKDPIQAEEVAQEIKALGRRVLIIRSDLDSVAEIQRIFSEILATLGRIDIVVSNAAAMIHTTVADTTEDLYDETNMCNVKVPFFIMQECAKHMANDGRVINVISGSVGFVLPRFSVYSAAKAAQEQFARAFSKEVGHRGITVNSVGPGIINTSQIQKQSADAPLELEAFKAMSPFGRIAEVDDVAAVVEFLASPAARWVTGQTIFANGGISSR